jgi:hypothetical protein
MRAYRFVPLRNEPAIQTFVGHYAAHATRIPAPPLLRDVFAVSPDLWATFDGHGRMLGGFELLRGDEMTCHSLFDWASTPLGALPSSAVVELNCVWLAPELRQTWGSIRFWRGLACCLQRLPETHIVFAVDDRKPGLARFWGAGAGRRARSFDGGPRQIEWTRIRLAVINQPRSHRHADSLP